MQYHTATDPLVMEAASELICSKSGEVATRAAFDSVAACHFSDPYDALQSLFAWGITRNHIKLVQKMNRMRCRLPFAVRVTTDPTVSSPCAVWQTILQDSLARRSPSERRQFVFDSVIMLIVYGCMDTVRLLCRSFPPASSNQPCASGATSGDSSTGDSGTSDSDTHTLSPAELPSTVDAAINSVLDEVVRRADVRTLRSLLALRPAVFSEQRLLGLLAECTKHSAIECAAALLRALVSIGVSSLQLDAALLQDVLFGPSAGEADCDFLPQLSKRRDWGVTADGKVSTNENAYHDDKLPSFVAILALLADAGAGQGKPFFQFSNWSVANAQAEHQQRTKKATAAQTVQSSAATLNSGSVVGAFQLILSASQKASGTRLDLPEVALCSAAVGQNRHTAAALFFMACFVGCFDLAQQMVEHCMPLDTTQHRACLAALRAQGGASQADTEHSLPHADQYLADNVWRCCPLSPPAVLWSVCRGCDLRTLPGMWRLVSLLIKHGNAQVPGWSHTPKQEPPLPRIRHPAKLTSWRWCSCAHCSATTMWHFTGGSRTATRRKHRLCP